MSSRGRELRTYAGCALGLCIPMNCVILQLAVIVWIAGPVLGFQGGTGKPCDPYQVASAEDLLRIGSDIGMMSKSFILVEDIDLDPNLPGGRVFDRAVIGGSIENESGDLQDPAFSLVAGGSVALFRGSFFGNEHVIRNMVIDACDTACIGLFGYIGEEAVVSDFWIVSAHVKGRMHVGVLAGLNAGTVSYCGVSGSVSAASRVGGLVGTNRGALSCCASEGRVSGEDIVGGLVGHAIGRCRITQCRTRSCVFGQKNVGGLAGEMLGGQLTGCFACGTATSTTNAGGLVGRGPMGGAVVKCQSTVGVEGAIVGGLIGIAQRTSVNNSHAFGVLTQIASAGGVENAALGGIVGYWRGGGGSIISSSWRASVAATDAAIGLSACNATISLLSTSGHKGGGMDWWPRPMN